MEGHCTFDNIIGIGVLQEYFCEDCDMALQFEQYERNFFCTQCKRLQDGNTVVGVFLP